MLYIAQTEILYHIPISIIYIICFLCTMKIKHAYIFDRNWASTKFILFGSKSHRQYLITVISEIFLTISIWFTYIYIIPPLVKKEWLIICCCEFIGKTYSLKPTYLKTNNHDHYLHNKIKRSFSINHTISISFFWEKKRRS